MRPHHQQAEILRELTPTAVARALEEHLLAYAAFAVAARRLAEGASGDDQANHEEVHDEAELSWVSSPRPSASANHVLRTAWPAALGPQETRARVDAMLARFAARGVPCSWRVGPLSRPADLGQSLVACGLRLQETHTWYALDLLTLPGAGKTTAPGVRIAPVQDARTHEEWITTLAEDVFASGVVPEDERERTLASWHRQGFALPLCLTLARLDEEPVGTASIFLAGGVAGLSQVYTAPRARGRGIGTAITLAALEGARGLDYRVAVLTATPMGLPIYERLGFRPVATDRIYIWAP
jgi:GNAT superfamily N-acetyltransferase